ncbi:hypothetical protein PsYK624_028310 [Phanerochaete sordida]|uniref:Uncharacterized protein n=1 Tax=Phanerochaete sordida TaxID=48140 RepID=A0A9P3G2L3_9APHY|nr:hypothetical protein PsYK624_028310 [Phanerochaete sordida]
MLIAGEKMRLDLCHDRPSGWLSPSQRVYTEATGLRMSIKFAAGPLSLPQSPFYTSILPLSETMQFKSILAALTVLAAGVIVAGAPMPAPEALEARQIGCCERIKPTSLATSL